MRNMKNMRRELPLGLEGEERIRWALDFSLFATYALIGGSHFSYLLFNYHQAMIILDSLSGTVICFLLNWMLEQKKSKRAINLRMNFVSIFCLWAALNNQLQFHLLIAMLELFTLYHFRKKVPLDPTPKIIEFYGMALWVVLFLYSIRQENYNASLACQIVKAGLIAGEWSFFTFGVGVGAQSMKNLQKHQQFQANLIVGFALLLIIDFLFIAQTSIKVCAVLIVMYELYFLGALVFLILFRRDIIRMRAFRGVQTVYHIYPYRIVYPLYMTGTYADHMNINRIQSVISNNPLTMSSCIKCYQNISQIFFEMCNHVCLCRRCALQMHRKGMNRCPICQVWSNRHLRLQMEQIENFSYWKHGIEIRGLLQHNQYLLKGF